MMERQESLAKVMTEEQGKPLRTAGLEIQYGAEFFLWYAEEAKRVYGELIPAPRADQRFMVIHQPIGVVGAITPWNYPSSTITRKLAPALAAAGSVWCRLAPRSLSPQICLGLPEIVDPETL